MERNLNFLLDILNSDFLNNNNRDSNKDSNKEENNQIDDQEQYNNMILHLYKHTLPFDQTFINKEEQEDLELTYKDLVSSKNTNLSESKNQSEHSENRPVSSVYYEYRNNNGTGSSVRISSSYPLYNIPSLSGMMSNMMMSSFNEAPFNEAPFGFGLMNSFNQIPELNSVLESFLRAFTDTGEQPAPLQSDIFNTFKEVPFDQLKNHTDIEIADNCSICLSGFKDENKLALVTPCGHYFHKPCIKEWLTKCHYKCPICKRSCDPSRKDPNDKKSDIDDQKID